MSADGYNERPVGWSVDVRPALRAPSSAAAYAEREAWAQLFVAWFLSLTGGDPEIDGVPSGHRWRLEYFECVRDPQTFERRAEQEIEAFFAKEKIDGEGK